MSTINIRQNICLLVLLGLVTFGKVEKLEDSDVELGGIDDDDLEPVQPTELMENDMTRDGGRPRGCRSGCSGGFTCLTKCSPSCVLTRANAATCTYAQTDDGNKNAKTFNETNYPSCTSGVTGGGYCCVYKVKGSSNVAVSENESCNLKNNLKNYADNIVCRCYAKYQKCACGRTLKAGVTVTPCGVAP